MGSKDVISGVPFADLVLMPLKGTEDFVAEVDKAINSIQYQYISKYYFLVYHFYFSYYSNCFFH